MGLLSPQDRARETAAINLRLLDMLKRRKAATGRIADALLEIVAIDNEADGILDELADLKARNPGMLSGS